MYLIKFITQTIWARVLFLERFLITILISITYTGISIFFIVLVFSHIFQDICSFLSKFLNLLEELEMISHYSVFQYMWESLSFPFNISNSLSFQCPLSLSLFSCSFFHEYTSFIIVIDHIFMC